MRVINHRLFKTKDEPVRFLKSPNCDEGLQQEYLVIHYTAGRNADESVRWLANRASKASAHLVIGRDGSIIQLVPFDKKAWHAGFSAWEDRVGLNGYSIGIELDNAGCLQRHGTRWRAWFGDEYEDSDVLEAVHKNEKEIRGWHIYPTEQIEVALKVGELLARQYNLRDIIGHEDIAPSRKTDPGPAFPMGSFRARCLGRCDDVADQYETTTSLNIRVGPGTQFLTISGSPLPLGTQVGILKREETWAFVDVLQVVNEVMDMQGWVHSKYLKRAVKE